MEKGTILHQILEVFMEKTGGKISKDALKILLAEGEAAFAKWAATKPAVKVFWQPRFDKVAPVFIERQRQRQTSLEVVKTEVKGKWEIPGLSFTLSAKADRIDRSVSDGSFTVIDYKAGGGKGPGEVRSGHSPQLPLEGVMIEKGAFEGIPEGKVAALEYWTIGDPTRPAEVKEAVKKQDIPDALAEAEDGLKALAKAFGQATTPYLATPDPDRGGYGEYDHLSRLKEWQNRKTGTGDG